MSPTEQPMVRTDPEPFRVTLAEGPRSLSPARRALRDWLTAAGADPDWIDEVLVALSEACTNALEHAYAGQDLGSVEVNATINAGSLEMVVVDHGVWQEPLDRGNRGRGRNLMEHLMDRTLIESGPEGTVVRLQKELRPGS